MSKTLDTLLQKAIKNRTAVKNGRIKEYDFGHVYVGDLQEQWAIEYTNHSNVVELRHWGTVLVKYNHVKCLVEPNSLYMESKSDKDALNWFFNNFNIDCHAHWFPSRYEGEIHDNSDDTRIKAV